MDSLINLVFYTLGFIAGNLAQITMVTAFFVAFWWSSLVPLVVGVSVSVLVISFRIENGL